MFCIGSGRSLLGMRRPHAGCVAMYFAAVALFRASIGPSWARPLTANGVVFQNIIPVFVVFPLAPKVAHYSATYLTVTAGETVCFQMAQHGMSRRWFAIWTHDTYPQVVILMTRNTFHLFVAFNVPAFFFVGFVPRMSGCVFLSRRLHGCSIC